MSKNFDLKRLAEDDPTYAPGISWNGTYAKWKAPKKYIVVGFHTKELKLATGTRDDSHQHERARIARQQTREMLAWWDEQKTEYIENTWAWLIHRYKTDGFSPYQAVKSNTREGYDFSLERLNAGIGHTKIASMNFETAMKMKHGMRDNGRSVSYIHRMFTQLRMITTYGKLIRAQGAQDVSSMLSDLRIETPPKSGGYATREQVMGIANLAAERGMLAFAVGIRLQFEFALRAVDVRGQWLTADPHYGGIHRSGRTWQDGMTWDMLDTSFTTIEKVISKTAKSLPTPYIFDLTAVPDLRDMVHKLRRQSSGIGPLIVSERHKMPYTKYAWSQAWRRLRDDLGYPKQLKMMETRAGAASEASQLDISPAQLRDGMQHQNTSTTDRYLRARSDNANKIVRLRNEK